ncbi:MAG: hypothetical protein CSA66_01565 [Proteobacteria bacterium]|nr:MAG: hypothetical protein CSA66_01565 [Pseudomonadota bacterium]
MYGYLSVDGGPRAPLRRAECGLCAHYGRAYRARARWLAATDPGVLATLLGALRDEPAPRARVRCPLRLGRRRRAIDPSWEPLRLVAALQLFLAGEKLHDDLTDGDRRGAGLLAGLLRKDVAAAEELLQARGFPLEAVRARLRGQAAAEADTRADLDDLAAPTGEALAAAIGWIGVAAGCDAPEALTRFAHALGRALYLVDALADLRRDRRRGSYNPIDHMAGELTPTAVRYLARVLALRLGELEAAFEALPLRRHAGLLRRATVASLGGRGRAALKRLPTTRMALIQAEVTS